MQDRGDDPSTSINIRGLQDFGRVAVVVDGARQNYQRTGHFANGSFFLDPELIGGIDIVRGPTANIYGSGAIGGVASFRTKDIQDVVRAGERWGVDINSVFGTNQGRALGSVFGGVRVNPNVDVFGGRSTARRTTTRTAPAPKSAIPETGSSAGLAKLTVRPADGHEVKLGTIFQEYHLQRRPAAAPRRIAHSTNPNGTNNLNGTSVYQSNVKNYTTTLGWKYSQPGRQAVRLGCQGLLESHRKRPDQDRAHQHDSRTAAYCGPGVPGNNVSGCIGSNRGYLLDTIGIDVYNTSRFEIGDWRHAVTYGLDAFQDKVVTYDQRGNSNVTTPGGKRTVSGGFVQWKANYTSHARDRQRGTLRQLRARIGHDVRQAATACRRRSRSACCRRRWFTPYVSYAEGYRAPSITETLVSGRHATARPVNDFLPSVRRARRHRGGDSTSASLPNPNLRPEVGKNKEIGFNVKKNGMFTPGDSFRGKFNVFRNDVDGLHRSGRVRTADLGPSTAARLRAHRCRSYQYQNIAAGQDPGLSKPRRCMTPAAGLSASPVTRIRTARTPRPVSGLHSIPPRKVTTTAGVRLFDNRLWCSRRMWSSVSANNDIPVGYLPATSLRSRQSVSDMSSDQDIRSQLSVDNLLNQYYRPYAIPGGSRRRHHAERRAVRQSRSRHRSTRPD